MTKKGFTLLLIQMMAVVISCAHRTHHRESAGPVEVAGELMMVGKVAYEDILEHFPKWKAAHQGAQPAEDIIDAVKEINIPLEIQCFVGTWCSDSRNEVPPFMKSLDQAANPYIHIELFGVDRQKDDPEHLALMNSIDRVPTFIIRSNGAELFRMVEFPKITFAKDLLNNLESGK